MMIVFFQLVDGKFFFLAFHSPGRQKDLVIFFSFPFVLRCGKTDCHSFFPSSFRSSWDAVICEFVTETYFWSWNSGRKFPWIESALLEWFLTPSQAIACDTSQGTKVTTPCCRYVRISCHFPGLDRAL